MSNEKQLIYFSIFITQMIWFLWWNLILDIF